MCHIKLNHHQNPELQIQPIGEQLHNVHAPQNIWCVLVSKPVCCFNVWPQSLEPFSYLGFYLLYCIIIVYLKA